jgi:hypothetical protein
VVRRRPRAANTKKEPDMNKSTRQTMKSIEKLRLPELQVRFAEIVGESTRSPNRNYAERADMRSRLGVRRKSSCICARDTGPLDTDRSA